MFSWMNERLSIDSNQVIRPEKSFEDIGQLIFDENLGDYSPERQNTFTPVSDSLLSNKKSLSLRKRLSEDSCPVISEKLPCTSEPKINEILISPKKKNHFDSKYSMLINRLSTPEKKTEKKPLKT